MKNEYESVGTIAAEVSEGLHVAISVRSVEGKFIAGEHVLAVLSAIAQMLATNEGDGRTAEDVLHDAMDFVHEVKKIARPI